MSPGSRRAAALLALLFALSLAAGAAGSGFPDFQDQHAAGKRIAEGEVLYRDHVSHLQVYHYPPVYLHVLGGVYALLGPDPLLGKAVLALSGVAAAGMLYLAARRLYGERAALLGLALFAVNPLTLAATYVGYFDLFVMALALASLLLVLRGRPGSGGAALGLGFMSKPFPVLLLPLFALYLRGRDAARFVAGSLSAAAVVSLPFLALAPERYLRYAFLYNFERAGTSMSLYTYFLPSLDGALPLVLTAGFVAAALVAARRVETERELFAAVPLLFLGFVALNRVNYPHYLLYVTPVASALLGHALLTRRRHGLRLLLALSVTLVGAGVWAYPWIRGAPSLTADPLFRVGAAIYFLGAAALLAALHPFQAWSHRKID